MTKTKLNLAFLDELSDWGYITNHAKDNHQNTHILIDSLSQISEGSVWGKLVQLAKKGLLKADINRTVLDLANNYLFTDDYTKCTECGKLVKISTCQFIDSGWNYGYYCENCIK